MPDKLFYGLSEKEIRILRDEAAMRAKNRQYYLKEMFNPFKHAHTHGGYLFDPALQRYLSMSVSHLEHFRPTPKSSVFGFLLTFGAIGLYAYLLDKERQGRFDLIKTGQVSYRDRNFKLA